jgi:hypothetical protein
MHSKFWFGNLNYKDFTADEKLILTGVLKKQNLDWVHVIWYRVEVTAMEVVMSLQVANFFTSAIVRFSKTSLNHMHNQSRFRQHAFIPRRRDRGSSGLEYIYQKFILTSPLHAIHIEIPFQPLRITSRTSKCTMTLQYSNPHFTCHNLPYFCDYLFAPSLRKESLHRGQITER